jgi:hypothetical protein
VREKVIRGMSLCRFRAAAPLSRPEICGRRLVVPVTFSVNTDH